MNKKQIAMYFGSPLHQAFISERILEFGMGNTIISRKTAGGAIVGVHFVCDHYCLGVKDCLVYLESEASYRSILQQTSEVDDLREEDPGYVKKYILDLVDWSKSLGFSPHSDYRFCQEILRGIPTDTKSTFTFGKDGIPTYINGPFDTPDRVQSIIKTLMEYKARTGNEADYGVVAGGDSPISIDALGALELPEAKTHILPDEIDDANPPPKKRFKLPWSH